MKQTQTKPTTPTPPPAKTAALDYARAKAAADAAQHITPQLRDDLQAAFAALIQAIRRPASRTT